MYPKEKGGRGGTFRRVFLFISNGCVSVLQKFIMIVNLFFLKKDDSILPFSFGVGEWWMMM